MAKNLLRAGARQILPPIVVSSYKLWKQKYGFFGDFPTWQEACAASSGYDQTAIFEKVKAASLAVQRGEAVYERDSVIFGQVQYSFPILAGLLQTALKYDGRLSVLDFGGALGSSYYQCRDVLSVLHSLQWSIVEQPHFVECGQSHFEDESLKFYFSIDECLQEKSPHLLLLSSVVQYLESPYNFLEKIIDYKIEQIIFDRTAFSRGGRDRLTIQKVPPDIYPASYPAWFLSETKFLSILLEKYELIFDFESMDKANLPSIFKGFYLQLKNAY
ncbi:MAG: methyltransferase, TIGR04325 family [Leptolyngbyaceae cyanobacterium]